MSLEKDLDNLVKAAVITTNDAERIRQYYRENSGWSANRLFIVFAILGAILCGLGIILIIAHNWDDIPRTGKTIIAFIPVLLGQVFCGYALFRRNDMAWTESSSVFLALGTGACISLISQIYNIPGNVSSFLFTWMLLCIPMVYIMRSWLTSLLCIIGITWYAAVVGYDDELFPDKFYYWGLMATLVPFYIRLRKERPDSNMAFLHDAFFMASVMIVLATVIQEYFSVGLLLYILLFGLLNAIAGEPLFYFRRQPNMVFRTFSFAGMLVLFIVLSFSDMWKEINRDLVGREVNGVPKYIDERVSFFQTSEFLFILIFIGLLVWLWFRKKSRDVNSKPDLIGLIPFVFILIFLSSFIQPGLAAILTNLLVLAIGLLAIREGSERDHLGILNFGLLIIAALVVSRFFDDELSFVVRGLLFLAVGCGFFYGNYSILRKRRKQ